MFHTLPEMKSRTFMKTVSCVGILLYLSGFTQCQRRMVAPGTIQGTRTAGTVGGVRSPGMRLRSMGTVPSSQISNQTSSRRGSPRLLGFIIPSAGGGRPQLRLMPGAQDFIRPGRRIAAAPISQLSRLGGSRTNPTSRVLRGRGTSAARSLTNVPTSVLNQARSGFRGTATQGGQIRRLPQSALNTISDAARGRAQTQNRQPNIVFVRPPARTSARTSGLSPDMVRRIRLAAMQRANNGQRGTVAGQRVLPSGQMISTNGQRIAANGQRIATAGQRMIPTGQRIATAGQRVPTVGQRIATGFNRNAMLQSTGFNGNAAQPQTLNRAPVQTGIRRVGTQTRMLPDLATRRRIAAMNAARNRAASVPRQTMPVQRGTVQTDVLRPRVRGPARVDEAVLQANIVPAGLSPSLSGIRRSGSTLTSGSISRELPAAPTVSSDSRMITSGSTSGSVGGGVMSTGRSGVQPTETVIAPAPDIQFRTTVGETPVSSVSAGVSGIGGAAPILDAGPAFQVVSGDASNVIIGPGASVADTLPVDVSGASGPTMGVNPTVVSSGTSSVTAMDNTPGFTGGATLSMADPTVRAAVDPTLASLGSVIGATGIQTVGALPTLESIGSSGSSAMVPGAGNVATTIAESNPDMNSIKSVITDVLRDMAAQGQSSNVQPDIGMMARAVLEAQQSAHDKPNPIGSHQTVPDTKPRKPIVQTFTLTPESPSIILNADPTSVVSSPTEISNNLIAPSKASIQHSHSDFFGGAGHGTDIHHTAKPVVTSHAPVNTAPTFPVVTDPHMIDAFHTHGPHDLLHGHVHPEPQLVLHDSLHHHIPHTHEILPTDVGVTKPKLQTKSTTVKQRITTTPAPPTTKAANEQRNLIVGDWSGAEQSLSGNQPPPPPSRDLALEHPHGHHHFESHVHGFTKPSIPPPPPTAEMVLTTNPVDVQPTDQLMDKQPTLQIVDVQPVGQQVDIQPSNQLIDLHHPNQPIDTHLVGVLDNITPKNASPATGNTVAKSASTGTKETSGVHNVLIDPNIGHLSHDPLHSITDHGHSIHDLGHLVTDPGTSAHQAGPASHGHGHNLSAGDLSSLYLDITQLEQLLGLHPNSISANQIQGAGITEGPNVPTNSSKHPFLSNLASLFTHHPPIPRNSNSNTQASDHNVPSASGNNGNNAQNKIQNAKDSPLPQNVPTESVVAGFDISTPSGSSQVIQNDTPPPNVVKVKNPKSVNISQTLDKNVNLNKSETKNNQTVSKRIRTINIKTTITKKHKPVSPAPNLKSGANSQNSKSKRTNKNRNASNSLTGVAGQQGTLTGLGGAQNALGVNDPARSKARAEMIDSLMDGMSEGFELMGGLMALNSMGAMSNPMPVYDTSTMDPNAMFFF